MSLGLESDITYPEAEVDLNTCSTEAHLDGFELRKMIEDGRELTALVNGMENFYTMISDYIEHG